MSSTKCHHRPESRLEGMDSEGKGQEWLVTFADLMALLLTFFVVLLTFSEINTKRFKKVAGSLKNAFGGPSNVWGTQATMASIPWESRERAANRFDFPRLQISLEANEICELEQQRKSRQEVEVAILGDELKRLLSMKLKGVSGIHVGREPSRLRIRLFEDHLFREQTALLDEDQEPLISQVMESLFGILPDQKLSVSLTNYLEPVEELSQIPGKWRLSTDRLLTMMHVMSQIEAAAHHEIKVESRPSRQTGPQGVIDLFVEVQTEETQFVGRLSGYSSKEPMDSCGMNF